MHTSYSLLLCVMCVIVSLEPKAHRWAYSIGRHPSSVRPSSVVNIFKRLLLWSREADSFHIPHIASIDGEGGRVAGGGGGRIIMFFVPIGQELWLLCKLIVSTDFNDNRKSGNWQFLLFHCRYLDFLQKCFLGSPLRFIWILSKKLNLIRVNFRKNY